jgi:hypothetical protein
LVGALDRYWTKINGWALSQGVDLHDLHFDGLLDLTYYWLTKDAEEEDVEKFDSRLWLPPKNVKPEALKDSPWSDEATRASLAAFAEGVGG